MAGLSINLKAKKSKNKANDSSKKKRSNLFNDDDEKENKRTKIKLTHVEEYRETKPKKLIIKPAATITSSRLKMDKVRNGDASEGMEKLKYGLNNAKSIDDEEIVGLRLGISADTKSIDELPDETKQEEYENVPIEEFGAALLRGMGWKDEEDDTQSVGSGKKKVSLPHEQQGRPEFLGIGAKSVPGDSRKPKLRDQTFMPVVKINKKTGKKAIE